jgi:hypothetical protein
MTGYTDEVEKALFLRRWAVSHWGLAYVFGRDERYWYRLENRLGRNSLVGTTVKDAHKLPENVLADEKHTRFNGQKAYIATTVADDCVMGASVSLGADAEHLTEAYGHFKTEGNYSAGQDYVCAKEQDLRQNLRIAILSFRKSCSEMGHKRLESP